MFRNSKRFMPTYVLIIVNIAFYIFTSILSDNFIEMDAEVLARYGQMNVLVFHGWYWQLLTSMFVHVNIVHIVGNMVFLLIFGLRAEEVFGIEEYMFVYLLSGLAGSLLTLFLMDPLTISAGASGAIFGMFGAVTIYVNRVMRQPIGSALIYAFFMLMLSIGLNVNIFAHAGGLVVGLLLGYSFALRRRRLAAHQFSYSYTT